MSAYRGAGGEVAEESLPGQANEVARVPASPFDQASLSAGGVVALQRRLGNAATVDVLRGAGLIPIAVANQRHFQAFRTHRRKSAGLSRTSQPSDQKIP